MVSRYRVRVNRHRRPIGSDRSLEPERPQQLGHRQQHVALCEVHSRADPSPGTIAKVVALGPVAGGDILGRQQHVGLVSLGQEPLRLLPDLRVHVYAPDIKDGGSAAWEEFAIDPVIFRRL